MITLSEADKQYMQQIWDKIDKKMQKVSVRSYDKFPYTSVDGVHNDLKRSWLDWWTNGFWGGMMWILYAQTGNEQYKKTAIHAEDDLRRIFTERAEGLHHDVGFMWNITSGVHYRLEGDMQAKNDLLLAAFALSSRFNIKGNFIRAWNDVTGKNKGWVIVDSMMNIPMLYHASKITGDERFADIAKAHANKTMQYHIRPDGSVKHIVSYDPETGEYIEEFGGQGYGVGSAWSRGQAWALYGFALNYIYTKDEAYLNTAKKVANYFISCLSAEPDFLPLCDFRAPKEPLLYDATAGCCAACGLIEIANCVDEYEKQVYLQAAIKLIKAMTDRFVDFSEDTDSLVNFGTEAYHKKEGDHTRHHIPMIYGDYFYIEAIYKLVNEKQDDMLFW